MIGNLFTVILRSIAIPYVAIMILQDTFLEERGAWLAVIITLGIVNAIAVIIDLVKILPNTLLLKGGRVISLIISIIIQAGSVIGFIYLYSQRF